jgi:aminomethyltransferase
VWIQFVAVDTSGKLKGLMEPVKRTPLSSLHGKLGARLTEFGGFEMPLSYLGIIQEHLAVRQGAGLFDLSHMGEFYLEGPHALALLERALTNSASRLGESQAQYTIMCAEDGGSIDDLIVYRLAKECYMLCVNASNIDADWKWLCDLNRNGATLTNRSDETALIALQGPLAVQILSRITKIPVVSMKRFRIESGEVAGMTSLIARTGYTGEDGFEIFCPAAAGERVFEAALAAGVADQIKPCGLGARDTLRMEAALPLYGHELDRATSPVEANLKQFIKFGHGFVGEAALAAQRDGAASRRLVGIRTEDGRSIARQGYKIYVGESEVGEITSGTYSPSFHRPLAMGFVVTVANLRTGAAVEVAIRNRRVAATVVPLPFYRREHGAN